MNTRNITKIDRDWWVAQAARTAVLVVAVTLLAGCRSTGYMKSDATAWKLQTAGGQVRAESRTLEATTTALDDLVNAPAGDLRLQFQRFSRALDQLAASHKEVQGTAGALERKRTAYFETWDKQMLTIDAEDLRKQSEARRTEVSNQYDTTYRHFQETQEALAPVISYLQDLRKTLVTDLTLPGLQAVKPSVATAKEKATQVQTQLAQSAAELDALGARMSSFAAQNTK